MSARHRALLLQRQNNANITLDDCSALSDDDTKKIINFSALVSESGSDSDSETESQDDSDAQKHINDENLYNNTHITDDIGEKQPNEIELLDAYINAKDTDEVEGVLRVRDSSSIISTLFSVDRNQLDIDVIMRKRFGGMAFTSDNEGGPRRGRLQGRSHTTRTLRKFAFGPPKEDWPRPPSFIGGGIGMYRADPPLHSSTSTIEYDKNISWFRFVWSDEYSKQFERFQEVQNSGDVNRLVLFLSHHPNQVEGLLQLGMVFARTGHMDRAMDLVRRSLFCLECAFMESFKPQTATCRLDPVSRENAPIFAALLRYMQMSSMLGCPSVAADIGCLLFSLDPCGDTMHVLLSLDHLLIRAELYDRLRTIFESKISLSSPSASAVDDAKINATEDEIDRGDEVVTIVDLPGWSFSFALSTWLEHQRDGSTAERSEGHTLARKAGAGAGGNSGAGAATAQLKDALSSWPFMLMPLVEAVERGGAAVASSSWRRVSSHPFFKLLSRLDAIDSDPLSHLAAIYATRNASIWRRPSVTTWLVDTAASLLEDMDSSSDSMDYEEKVQVTLVRLQRLGRSAVIRRYSHALLEDFGEEYPRLPPDANPLDPRLMDPRLLAPGGRGLAAGLGLDEFGVAGMAVPNELVEAVLSGALSPADFARELSRRFGIDAGAARMLLQNIQMHRRGDRDDVGSRRGDLRIGYLDLNLPLLQLFWQSFLPWNEIDPTFHNRRHR